jgi:hypothetical protein
LNKKTFRVGHFWDSIACIALPTLGPRREWSPRPDTTIGQSLGNSCHPSTAEYCESARVTMVLVIVNMFRSSLSTPFALLYGRA